MFPRTACIALTFLAAAGCSPMPQDEFGNNLNCKRKCELLGTGEATWYGNAHQGRTTASGEIFDVALPTAAHMRLPFGTEVMVVNLNNNEAVRVVINDRGQFPSRDIDLSKGAMRAIGGLSSGRVPVQIYQCNRREMRAPKWE